MALFDLNNSYDVEKFRKRVAVLLDKGCQVELKEKKPLRTLSQNAYAHVLIGYFASEFGLSMESVKYDIFKKLCNADLFICKKKNKRGQEIEYIRSSSDLDTEEFSLAIDRFRNWSASVAGLYLPNANEEDALFYAQQQIEKNGEFI